MNAVEIEALGKRFGDRAVLKDLTLSVNRGERLVILGPTGCGKTTLLRILAGLATPDQGKVYLDDRLAAAEGLSFIEPEDRNIGMVFQDLALWPHFNVLQQLEFGKWGMHLSRRDKYGRIAEILRRVGLEGFEKRLPASLSGGEQQRVALARALVGCPRLLLLDEPLSSLDFVSSYQLRGEILGLQEEIGFTMIFVTHNLEEAQQMATQVAVLEGGQIRWLGSPSNLQEYFDRLIERCQVPAV